MKFWPETLEQRLRDLHRQGLTIRACAEDLGLSYLAVQSKAIRMGLAGRHSPNRYADPEFIRLRAEGKTVRQIAKAMGTTITRVQNWVAEGIRQGTIERRQSAVQNPKWTPEKIAELRRLWASGHGPTAIASIMSGVTANAISGKASALGLPRKGYPKVRKPAPPRDYKTDNLLAFARKPRPQPTSTLWDKTETSRPFLERGRTECAWPLGERGDYHACCAPTMEGDTYCEHHRLMAGGLKVPGVRIGDFKRAA